ncbi:MAG TPA: hypothetical protein VHF27_00380 [Acidimicrobiales bacterium]|nr:hypothetical protein [Acidimicrobiales bacterium]
MVVLLFGLLGIVLILVRRPLGQAMLIWRQAFPLRNQNTKAGEIMVALVGGFFVLASIAALIWG